MSAKDSERRGSKDEEDNSEGMSDIIIDYTTKNTYLRGKFLGKGAHARVYLVTDDTDKKDYAVKVMKVESPNTNNESKFSISKSRGREIRLTQITKEVQIHGLMTHINIVKLDKWFQTDNKFYMLLEYCERNNLAHFLKSEGKLEEVESMKLTRQLVSGLQHIHSHGIIHRDLKPGNIYLTQDMCLKIGDFGLADKINSGRRGICGTPNYISPEVLNEQGYTPAVDVWAVGCITYHMLSGKPPFEAESQAATYDLIKRHYYTALPSSQASVAARHLINWTLEYRPEHRPTVSFILDHPWFKRQNITNRKAKCKKTSSNAKQRNNNRPTNIDKMERRVFGSVESEIHTGSTLQEDSNTKDDELSKVKNNMLPFWKSFLDKVQFQSINSLDSISRKNKFSKLKTKMSNLFKVKKKDALKKALEDVLKSNKITRARYESNRSECITAPSFISKWIDYSNEYGFGYQLTDGTSGVVLNDASQICLDYSKTRVTILENNQRIVYPSYSVPNEAEDKFNMLKYFQDYMDTNLSSGVDEEVIPNKTTLPSPLLKQWTRNDKVIVLELTNNVTQINFLHDHCKYVFHKLNAMEQCKEDDTNISMLVINEDRKISKFELKDLVDTGCPEHLLNHFVYIHSIL